MSGVVAVVEEGIAVFRECGHVLSGQSAFVRIVSTEQEGGDETGVGAAWKGLAYEPAFSLGDLVVKQARCQQWKGIVHCCCKLQKRPPSTKSRRPLSHHVR